VTQATDAVSRALANELRRRDAPGRGIPRTELLTVRLSGPAARLHPVRVPLPGRASLAALAAAGFDGPHGAELRNAVRPGLHAAALLYEAWLAKPAPEEPAAPASQHPGRIDVLYAAAVDRTGNSYAAWKEPGRAPVHAELYPPAPPDTARRAADGTLASAYAGNVPDGLDKILALLLAITLPPRPTADQAQTAIRNQRRRAPGPEA
jgi:hypothetical protein